jgi:Sulfotransferase domain
MIMNDIQFLIIGAAKSATTWLQHSLQQDAAISMPDPELHYFSRNYDKGDEWYLAQFSKTNDHTHVGEKSNSYLDTPQSAERISKALPKVKLIAQLRNPVDRAYSDYCMLYRRGEVGKDIDQYLDPRYAQGKRFLNGGLYDQQLRTYLDRFPANQLLVMFFEDVKINAQGQLSLARDFLQIESIMPILPVNKKVKDKKQKFIGPALGRYMRPFKPIVAPFRKTRSFNYLRGFFADELQYAPLTDDIRARMTDYYAPEVARLEKIVGKDLSGWLRGNVANASA